MASSRIGRINEEIMRQLSTDIRSLKDPRVQGMITITAVDTASDLRTAKVYVSVYDKSRSKEVLKGLKSAGGFLRRYFILFSYFTHITAVAYSAIGSFIQS